MRRLAKAATANFERKIWVLYADLGQVYLWCHASFCSASVFWNPAAAEVGMVTFLALAQHRMFLALARMVDATPYDVFCWVGWVGVGWGWQRSSYLHTFSMLQT